MIAAPPRIRRSEFEALRRCPSWGNDGSENAAFGTAIHEAIAAWLRLCDLAGTAVEPTLSMVPDHDPAVMDVLRRFTETHGPGLDTLYGVEVMLTHETPLATLTGTLDRVDLIRDLDVVRAVVITDWKSSWHVVDNTFQGKWYACLALLEWPTAEEVTVRFDYIRLGDGAGVVEFTYTREELLGE